MFDLNLRSCINTVTYEINPILFVNRSQNNEIIKYSFLTANTLVAFIILKFGFELVIFVNYGYYYYELLYDEMNYRANLIIF